MVSMNPFSHYSLFFFISLSSIICDGLVIKDGLEGFREVQLPRVVGPDSLAFCNGTGPHVSVSDGRILKLEGAWTEFAYTAPNRDRELCDGSSDYATEPICGRPMGLKFEPKTCNLYIADAYYGILVVEGHGGLAKQLAISDGDGVPLNFPNGLDVDPQTGTVYFSETSTKYLRRDWEKIITSRDKSGRLLKYDPRTKRVQVLLEGLAVPTGVALSKDGSSLLFAEYSARRILKYCLKGSKANTIEIFALLQRPQDKIKRNQEGNFWVGLNGKNKTRIAGLPYWSEDPFALKLDQMGKPLVLLDGRGGKELEAVSEVNGSNEMLWVGSVEKPYAGFLRI